MPEGEVDLAYLRDFLAVLRDSGVASFSGYGVSVGFGREDSRGASDVPARVVSMANVMSPEWPPIAAVAGETKDGWRNPNLWPHQNGKILKLDGSFE